MAERNEFRGLLSAHDPGEDGGVKDGAFFVLQLTVFHLVDEF